MTIFLRFGKLATLGVLTLCAAMVSAQTRDPLPVPNIPGYRTLKCDFHLHTVFSDGEVWPTTRVREAWRDGLDAISITDHDSHGPHQPDVGTDLNRPFAIAGPAAAEGGILLVPGVEISKGETHFNALFVKDANAFETLDALSALQRAKSQGAYVFWNHPGWKGNTSWLPVVDTAYKKGFLNGIELVNGRVFHQVAYPWAEEKGLAILANSDEHVPMKDEYTEARTRPLTLLFVKSVDLDGIRDALEARRSAVWAMGQMWGDEMLLRGLWDGAVKLETSKLKLTPNKRAQIRLWNRSAIPFEVRLMEKPAWLRVGLTELKAESIGALSVSATAEAPVGKHKITLELELRNLHVGPGRNLTVTLPLEIEIVQE